MARLTILTLLAALAALVLVFELLRRRRLRQKYAVIWLVIALGTGAVAIFPGVLLGGARLVGIQTPSNLLFLVSLVTLFAVSLQLSGEVGILEEQTRRLAEEVAALRMRVDDAGDRDELPGNASGSGSTDEHPLRPSSRGPSGHPT